MSIKVSMACGILKGDAIYLSAICFNGLFKYDLNKGKLQYVLPFAEERACYAIHHGVVGYKDEIWFVPQHGKKVAIYNLRNGSISYLDVLYQKAFLSPIDNLPTISYSFGLFDDNKLYILPAAIDSVNIVNMDDKSIRTIRRVISEGEYISASVFHNGIIYAFTGDGKWIIEINPYTGSFGRRTWKGISIVDIKWIPEKGAYIATEKGTGYYWIDESFENVEKEMAYSLGYIDYLDGMIVLYPWNSNSIVMMDIHNYKDSSIKDKHKRFYIPISNSNNALCTMINEAMLIDISIEEKRVHEIPLHIELSEIVKKATKYGIGISELGWNESFGVIGENTVGLEDFLRCL